MVVKSGILFALLALSVSVYKYFLSPNCHSQEDFPVIKYLATKSPYFDSQQFLYNFSSRQNSLEDLIPQGCFAEKIWLIVRHGTRNPSDKVITKMLQDVGKIRDSVVAAHDVSKGSLCPKELEALKLWQADLDLEPSKEKWLVPQGEIELEGIGSRFQKAFPNIFNKNYDAQTYQFKFTKTQRAEASAIHFAKGLFGADEAKKVRYPPALAADPILRFYKACPRWKKHIDKNPETYDEQRKFEKTPIFQGMIQNIQTRLGLASLTLSEVELLHQTCSFETAWNPEKLSPWCAVFTEQDLQILEYRQDLEYYWVDGYGHEITYKQACAPVGDILEQFSFKVANPNSKHKVTAYFTHSGTLLKFISHLGLFNDSEPLTSDKFPYAHRHWKTSFIDKFATNIAFVLFKCQASSSAKSNYKIGALFQEYPINIPCCQGDWICPLEQFQQYFESSVRTCSEDVTNMCKL